MRGIKITQTGDEWRLECSSHQRWTPTDRHDLEKTAAFKHVKLGGKCLVLAPKDGHEHEVFNAFLVLYMRFDIQNCDEPLKPFMDQAKKWSLALQRGF